MPVRDSITANRVCTIPLRDSALLVHPLLSSKRHMNPGHSRWYLCCVEHAPAGIRQQTGISCNTGASIAALHLTPDQKAASAGEGYPFGGLQPQARVHFQGSTQLTAEHICSTIDAVPSAPMRLTSICTALSKLVGSYAAPAPSAGGAAGSSQPSEPPAPSIFCNPLFGSLVT